jgi:putative transposase
MSIRTPLVSGEFYHIYNRGTDKRKIFYTKKDYERFICGLYLANTKRNIRLDNIQRNEQGSTLLNRVFEIERGETLVSIASYCLMPNHFHLLVRQNVDGGISRFIQKLTTAYTMYFNLKYKRNGALLQGKFKSKSVQDDTYLKYLMAYIHLNPYTFAQPNTYIYSSYQDFIGKRRLQNKLLDTSALPEYFPKPENFEEEMREWLHYRAEQGSTLLI